MRRFWIAALAVFLLNAVNGSVCAQTAFTSTNGVRFTLPDKWKAEEQGAAVRITAADGTVWMLKRDDGVGKDAGTDATRSVSLRDAAEAVARGIVQGPRYAGVKPLAVTGGPGAIFRYRGQGKQSGDELVEVRVAVVGKRAVVLAPASSPQTDHAYELGLLVKSLSFGEGGKEVRSVETPAVKEPPREEPRSAPSVSADATKPRISDATTTRAGVELETYEGHLAQGDVAFKLHVFEGGRATAEWERSVGRAVKYDGSYTGTDGNFAMKLEASPNNAVIAPSPLSLTLRSLGGMVRATYASGTPGVAHDVAELKLTGVYTPSAKLKGGKGNTQQSMNRGQQTNSNRGRSTSQRRRRKP
jgi:hypothetical protein